MSRSVVKIGVLVVGAVAALAVLRFKPWQKKQTAGNRPTLEVGYLPVT
jgi:hypothetical protein